LNTEQNLSIIRLVIEEGFNRGNYQVLPQCYNPDFIEHQFGLNATIAGVQSAIEFLRNKFSDFSLTIEDLDAKDDKVWVRMTARGTNNGGFMGPPNGKKFEVAVFDLCRFQDGKIVEHWGSPDRFAMMVQLGIIPQN
jgi:predicted ester cyclase